MKKRGAVHRSHADGSYVRALAAIPSRRSGPDRLDHKNAPAVDVGRVSVRFKHSRIAEGVKAIHV
jgi:hypothetical protein